MRSAAVTLLAACGGAEIPTRSTQATVDVDVPDLRSIGVRPDGVDGEVEIGQVRGGGGFQSYGRAVLGSSQFGRRVQVPVSLACGTSTGCTVQARMRLWVDRGATFDSADASSFQLAGGESKSTGGFVFRAVRRVVAADTLVVTPINGNRTVSIQTLDPSDRPLIRRFITWTTADPSIASVDSLGNLTGKRAGRTMVTASVGTAQVVVPVLVNAVQTFNLTASASRVIATLTVRLFPSLVVGPGLSTRVRYRSSDTTIADVSADGVVQTRRAGTVTLTAIADADSTEQRSVSLQVDAFRSGISYTYVGRSLPADQLNTSYNALWGTRADNVVAGGCGALARWNGSTWRVEQGVGYCVQALAGTGNDNIVAVGNQFWRYNGTAWARESYSPSGDFFGATAVDGVVYAVGTGGQILRRTNAGWSSLSSPTTRTLRSIHGLRSDNLWAVGDGGVILRSTGGAWQVMNPPDQQFWECRAVLVRGPREVLTSCNERNWGWSIQRWTGDGWERMETPQREFVAAFAESEGEVWAVGNQRTIFRLQNGTWLQDAERVGDVGLTAVYPSAAEVLVVGNDGLSLRRSPSGWTMMTGFTRYNTIWATASDFILAAGSHGGIDLFDGKSWVASRPAGAHHGILALWGVGRTFALAGGAFGHMMQFDGTTWRAIRSPTTSWVNAMWGVSRDSVWAVTGAGEILFYNGTEWSLTFRTGRTLQDIRGRDARNIVAVGNEGRVWRFDGRIWQQQESGTEINLRRVFVGATRAFAIGNTELLEYRDGEWRPPVTFENSWLNWIVGSSDADVYLGGCVAPVRRFDGTSWVPEVPTNVTTCTASGAVVPGGGLIFGTFGRDFVSGTGPLGNTPGRVP